MTDETHPLVQRIYDFFEAQEEVPRPHLGASLIGHHCERYIWLSFRWTHPASFPGRVRRLFRRGHKEEADLIRDLRNVGVKVYEKDPNTNRQFAMKHGHFGGSFDGIIRGGVEDENDPTGYILEIKTHSFKSFADLKNHGVQKSKPQHYAQMQCYLHSQGGGKALYIAVCKNDDHIYAEVVPYDLEEAKKLFFKAQRLSLTERLPEPISADPTWYQCKFCDYHDFCHGSKIAKNVNCRTCAHVTPLPEGDWSCARWEALIPSPEAQFNGCDDHVIHPDLVPWPMKPGDDGKSVTYTINGKDILNGHGGIRTSELLKNHELMTTDHPLIKAVMEAFSGAEVIQETNN